MLLSKREHYNKIIYQLKQEQHDYLIDLHHDLVTTGDDITMYS
jgi:hypothetical protein